MLAPTERAERAHVLAEMFRHHAKYIEDAKSSNGIPSGYLYTIEQDLDEAIDLGLLPELASIQFERLEAAVGYTKRHNAQDYRELFFYLDPKAKVSAYGPGEFNAKFPWIGVDDEDDSILPAFNEERFGHIAAGLRTIAITIEARCKATPPGDGKPHAAVKQRKVTHTPAAKSRPQKEAREIWHHVFINHAIEAVTRGEIERAAEDYAAKRGRDKLNSEYLTKLIETFVRLASDKIGDVPGKQLWKRFTAARSKLVRNQQNEILVSMFADEKNQSSVFSD